MLDRGGDKIGGREDFEIAFGTPDPAPMLVAAHHRDVESIVIDADRIDHVQELSVLGVGHFMCGYPLCPQVE